MRAYDITHSLQDLRYLTWDEASQPSGLGGPKPKAREGTGPNAVYYKLPAYNENAGSCGWDTANQLLCTRLARELGFATADCHLVHALVHIDGRELETWVLRSKSYREPGERAISLKDFFEMRCLPGEGLLAFCRRMGWGQQLGRMALLDYLSANRGRDSASLELLCSAEGAYRLAPLTGGSFSLTSAFPRRLWRLDPLADLPASSYPGGSSLFECMALASEGLDVTPLTPASKRRLTKGLEEVTPAGSEFLEGSWHIIWKRWEEYARLRDL